MKVKALPTGYHVQNFSTLLDTVYQQYNDLLSDPEIKLYDTIQRCSYDAKSLYVRLLTRKGPLFRIDKLNYNDISNTRGAITELLTMGLAQANGGHSAEDLFSLFTKTELLKLFAEELGARRVTRLRKSECLAVLNDILPLATVSQRIQAQFPFIEANYLDEFETFRTCFFGNARQDLSEFVITDLGHLHYESYALEKSARYFLSRDQIDNQIVYARLSQLLEDKSIAQDPELLFTLATELPQPTPDTRSHPALNRRYQRLLNTIARQLERLQQPTRALQLYRRCELHPSRERQARILKSQSEFEASWELCLQLSDSTHPEEREFAERFKPALAKLLGKAERRPAPPPVQQIRMPLLKNDRGVEQSVASALHDQDHSCFYVENTLFCSLFGLLFWDLIFTPITGAFINPFQRGPLDLFSEHFYSERKALLDERLLQLNNERWKLTVQRHYETKQGIANHFVHWGVVDNSLLEHCFNYLPAQDLQCIFKRILEHPGLYSSGFPDLIRFRHSSSPPLGIEQPTYQLIEVKAPGDKLQANQIRWLDYFSRHRIPAQVVWVDWIENG